MRFLFSLALLALLNLAIAQNITTPIFTPVATAAPVTPLPTTIFKATPSPPGAVVSTPFPPPSAINPPPPLVQSPPPPPGAGSQKTAVLSVIKLTGSNLRVFNSTRGDKYIVAMAQTYGINIPSIVIRNWGSSGRRLLSDTVTVGSAALFPNGISAASALGTLNTAANSGALQESFRTAGLDVESLLLESAVTALPSNFQPLYSGKSSTGLQTWAIVVIAVVGALVLLTFVFCCCRSCFCCCPARDEDGEEKLPNMIKFGSMKDQGTTQFSSSQAFKQTGRLQGKSLPTPAT